MHLPRTVYESLPFAYAACGLSLCAASYGRVPSPWTESAFVAGALGVVLGLVLWLRRRSYRDEAARYDSHSLERVALEPAPGDAGPTPPHAAGDDLRAT